MSNADVRVEKDSMGEVSVPADKLWGAQTQRSLEHFSIGTDLMPREMIAAYAILKKGAANANHADEGLDSERHESIVSVCDEILAGLASVDAVVIYNEPTPREIVTALLPDVLVKGGDWADNKIIGREEVEAAGGRVVSIPVVPGYSTTEILRKIREGAPSPAEPAPASPTKS